MKTKLKTTLALLAAFCGLQLFTATPAYAATRTFETASVIWDGDFGTTSKKGRDGVTYTLNLNGNTLDGDGAIKITSSTAGAYINYDRSGDFNGMTAIIKYSSLAKKESSTACLGGIYESNKDKDLVLVESSANNVLTLTGYWSGNSTAYAISPQPSASEKTGYLVISFKGGGNTYVFAGSSLSNLSGGSCGLTFSSTYPSGVNLGGPQKMNDTHAAKPWTDLKIEAVALFRENNNQSTAASDFANFKWPSQMAAAVFEGANLNGGTSAGYTLTLNNNTFADNKITIADTSKGVQIAVPSGDTTKQTVSVLFKYSGLNQSGLGTSHPALVSMQQGKTDEGSATASEHDVGVYATSEKFAGFYDNTDNESYGPKTYSAPESGYVLMCYSVDKDDAKGVQAYFGTKSDSGTWTWSERIGSDDLRFTAATKYINTIAVGGANTSTAHAPLAGMKIEGVAIFNSRITTTEAAAYKWPSEMLNDAYLWLDASEASTITRDASGMVTKWASRNAGGKAATSYSAGNVTAGPTVMPRGLGGKNVVDFGAADSKKDLQFDKSTTIRTVFMVAAVANNNNNNTFFLADSDSNSFNFHRGSNGNYFDGSNGKLFANGLVRRNGATVSNPSGTSVPTSYGVYTFVSTGNAKASRICQDRNVSGRQGGKQVGELIIFNKVLSDTEREWIENYLTSKWMSGAPEPTLSQGFDGDKNASAVLGGTAYSSWNEWPSGATYTEVRGSTTGKALNLVDSKDSSKKTVPNTNGWRPDGFSDSTSWSIHASMMLAEVQDAPLFGASTKTWGDTCIYIGVEYVGNDQVRAVYGSGKKATNKKQLIAPVTVTDSKTKFHSYLLTFNASASGTAESPYYTLYVDGVAVGNSGTVAKHTGYAVGLAVGNYYGGADQTDGKVLDGAKVDDFAVWATTCLSAEQAKGVAAQFPVWAPEYTATVSTDTNFEDINTWTPSKPAGGFTDGDNLKLTVEGTPTITFSQPYDKLVTLTINGTPKLAAGSSIFEDGCWQKTFVSVASLTAANATFADLPTGYSGAYGKTATGLTLRAQNKEVISLNIAGGDNGSGSSPDDHKVTGTGYVGVAPVQGNTWVNLDGKWGSRATKDFPSIVATLDGATTIAKTDMSATGAANNTYHWATATDAFLKGYLDDGSPYAQVVVNNIPYSKYDVIIYAATDENTAINFSAPTVNGTTYTCGDDGVAYAGNATWGKARQVTASLGVNAMVVKDLDVAELTIVGGANDGTVHCRGGIAAIQIVCTGEVVEEKDFTATISESKTFSQIQWDGGKTFQEGSLNTATITVSGEASASEVTITFDKPDIHLNVLKIISARPVKLSATEPLSMVSHIDLSKCTGMATYAWPVTALASGDNANLAYSGGSAAGSTIEIAHNGGTLNLTGGTWTFAQSTSSTATTVNMTDITASYPGSILGIGMATYTVGGASAITTPTFVLSQEDKGRTSVFTLKNTAALTVTGNVNKDENTSSIMFGHWNGPTTFTIQDNATFTATAAQVLVGRTGNNHTININGGTFTAKGIKASTNAGGTNTLNLNGGTLVLGDVGITTYNNAKTIAVNVTGDSKIVASAAMPITQAISVSAEKTLTLDPNAATITVSSAITGSGNIVVHDYSQAANGRVLFTGDLSGFTGTITFENGVYDLGTARTVPAKITLGTGVTIRATQTQAEYAQGIASSFTGFTPNATITLTKIGGGSEVLTVGEGGTASSTAEGVVHIDQQATYADATLTNVASTTASPYTSPLSYASVANLGMQYDSQVLAGESDTGVYLNHHPWIRNLSNTYMGSAEITLAIVGQMATSNNTMFVHFGHTSGSNPGIFLASGSKTDEVVVKMNEGTTLTDIATMTVPNAAKSRHVYVITKRDEGDLTTVSVYLDGARWKTVSVAKKTFTGGVQCGSDFGGKLKDGHIVEAVTNDTALLNVLRIYDRVIGPTEIAKYSSVYPYTSPSGTSRRTFEAATGSWIEQEGSTVWVYKKDDATAEVSTNAPTATSAINLTGKEGTETTISVNLDAATTYESLTVQAAQKITFVKAQGKDGEIDISGSSTISCPIEIQYGALDISGAPLTLVGDGAVAFDLSTLNVTNIFQTTEIPLTGDTAVTDKITIKNTPSVEGRSVALTRSGNQYVLTVTVEAAPLVYTVADAEPGQWSFHGVDCDEPTDWAQVNSTQIQKAGAGTGTIEQKAGFNYIVNENGGTLKFSSVVGNAAAITVNNGGTFDLNGKSGTAYGITLAGGSLVNDGAKIGDGNTFTNLTLTANSTIGGLYDFRIQKASYGATTINLGTFTLEKQGTNTLMLVTTTVKGTGTLNVSNGTLRSNESTSFADGGKLQIGATGVVSQRGGRTLTVGTIIGTAGGQLVIDTDSDGKAVISDFTLQGELKLVGTGTYGTITLDTTTLDQKAVADIGTNRSLTLAGTGSVKAKLSAAYEPGGVVALFTAASGANIALDEFKDMNGDVIDASYYTYANGVVTFKKEAKIGTTYYFTLKQAIEDTSATAVELVSDIATAEEITVSRAISFDGGTNILSNVSFTFNEGSLTLNTGCIGIGWKSGMSLSGGCCRFNSTTQSDWASHGPSSDYTMAQITAAVRGTYDYEFVKSGFEPEEGKSVIPVADQNGDAGVIKLNSTWVAEKTPGATTAEDQAKILNAPQNNGLMKWQNDVLGLTGTDPNAKPVVHFSQSASESGKIAFTLNGVDGDSGATVKFKVYSASEPGSLSWKAETGETASGSPAEVTLPTSGVRYYRYDVITETSK